MKSAADEVLLQLESLFVHFDCLVYDVHILLFTFFESLFGLSLVSEAFRVPELGVVGGQFESVVVVTMSQLEFLSGLPVKENVAAIEVDGGVFGVALDGHVEVFLGFLKLFVVVIS